MLHENVHMLDIDVDHWRNLQSLVLESAKAKRRIIVIHEAGQIHKFIHSRKAPIVRSVERITDPHADAERIYRDNADSVDFVAVFERRAFDAYFGEFQGTWRADEDLDVYVRRSYSLMDKYPDGIVTYPGLARETLGLQWRIGASYDAVESAVKAFVPPSSSVILGIFEGDALWATLVLHFDADGRADVVSTLDVSLLSGAGSRIENAREAVAWVDATYGQVSVALFTDREGAMSFVAARDKQAVVAELAARGALLLERAPQALSAMIAA
jgi:hypothetical protein